MPVTTQKPASKPKESRSASALYRAELILLPVCGAVLTAWSFHEMLAHAEACREAFSQGGWWGGRGVFATRAVAATLLWLAATAACCWRLRRGASPPPRARLGLRMLVIAPLVALLVTWATAAAGLFGGSVEVLRSLFFAVWILKISGPALFLALSPGLWDALVRWPPMRWTDVAMTNLAVALLLAEALLRLAAATTDSALFWDEFAGEAEIGRNIDRFRLTPTPPLINERGYFDDPFFRAGPDDLVVALLADSFGVGVVPRPYNFASVTEDLLRERLGERYARVAVHNFGVSAIAMPEYAYLLKHEAEPLNPAVVVLCVFVGNDLILGLERPERPGFVLSEWWVVKAPRRVAAVVAEVGGEGQPLDQNRLTAEPEKVPDYIDDPSLETPRLSEEAFLEMELDRVRRCDTADVDVDWDYRRFFQALSFFEETLGERLLLVVIPDEYQVNDALWATLMRRVETPADYDRDHPQKRIVAHCAEHGIDCVDLLGPLREEERRQRTYYLRDSHWNAFGNRVAAREIARGVERRLEALK